MAFSPTPARAPAPALNGRSRPLLTLALAAVLGLLAGAAPGTSAEAVASDPAGRDAASESAPVHSSDGRLGPVAAPLPAALRRVAVRTAQTKRLVVPGLRYRSWRETDARGPVRVHLLIANPRRPGLSLQYADAGRVAARAPLSTLAAAEKAPGGSVDAAVAGVNGDFFDIDDTGAPLGVGVDSDRVRHGPREGWVSSFRLDDRARASVGTTPVRVRVRRGPHLRITGLNAPYVPAHGIGLYTARWGDNPGYAVTDGAKKRRVRQAVVRGGRVVANTRRVDTGAKIRGRLLIGRGDGAVRLARRWPVGTAVRLRIRAAGSPQAAIGGSQVLLSGGALTVSDDAQLHPRTAVGVDNDARRVLLVVVDGRSEASRGMTLLELAELLGDLGADDALNLDGGGSSTMLARRPSGRLAVVNEPSDGAQRPVPNGLVLTYEEP